MAGIRIESQGNAVEGSERFSAEIGPALYRALLKGALALGRRIAENVEDFKETVGTRRLSRSFLTPEPDAGGNMILGGESPVYAAIHEYGGTIRPVTAEWLHWTDPQGGAHFAKEVHIREKRYARSAIEEFEASGEMTSILAAELHGALS
jgi:hypothetical protein